MLPSLLEVSLWLPSNYTRPSPTYSTSSDVRSASCQLSICADSASKCGDLSLNNALTGWSLAWALVMSGRMVGAVGALLLRAL